MNREEAIEHLKNMKMPHDKFYKETDETNKALIDKGNEALDMAIESLKNQKTGHWILADEQSPEDVSNDNYRYICSVCGHSDISSKSVKVNYCWYCGTKMEGVEQ